MPLASKVYSKIPTKMEKNRQDGSAPHFMSSQEFEHFASMASHDLQEPLHVIVNFLDLLALKYKDKLDPTAFEYIELAQKAALQGQTLVRELLSYSKIGAQLNVELVDMNEVLDRALINLKVSIEKNYAEIIRSSLPKVKATKVLMVQVFQNLISNALKYKSEQPLKIHVSAFQEDGEWIFCVEDNGIGIDAKHLPEIFEMFKRLHSKSKYPGSGIGLATCKKIIGYHNGQIWAESELGKGSKFCFSLPSI